MSELERRVAKVESVLDRLEPLIIRIDEQLRSTLPHLATKAEIADLRTEVRAGLAEKPSKTYMWGIVGVMTAAVFAAVVLGATLT
ncbi:hypothetical protein [uncultured Rhodospira sp.]|uniref:hypothetical protein n=1 Tax=uncultured Rhodospira sp. TaxID=1936189 RepID=UPI0026355EB4|nr:hypothetical protein [uncultured Rhodospira sp.]